MISNCRSGHVLGSAQTCMLKLVASWIWDCWNACFRSQLVFTGSDGRDYPFLLKPDDDLRKDTRMMETAGLLNRLFDKEPMSRRRNLYIRRYSHFRTSNMGDLIPLLTRASSPESLHVEGFLQIWPALLIACNQSSNCHFTFHGHYCRGLMLHSHQNSVTAKAIWCCVYDSKVQRRLWLSADCRCALRCRCWWRSWKAESKFHFHLSSEIMMQFTKCQRILILEKLSIEVKVWIESTSTWWLMWSCDMSLHLYPEFIESWFLSRLQLGTNSGSGLMQVRCDTFGRFRWLDWMGQSHNRPAQLLQLCL